jgi:CcmD family protein
VTTSEKYVTAAYLVVLVVVLAYVLIYSTKLARLDRELAELAERAENRDRG